MMLHQAFSSTDNTHVYLHIQTYVHLHFVHAGGSCAPAPQSEGSSAADRPNQNDLNLNNVYVIM